MCFKTRSACGWWLVPVDFEAGDAWWDRLAEAGFREVQQVSAATLTERYFADRADGLRPPNNAEELLVATT
jgi:hypothetical protein